MFNEVLVKNPLKSKFSVMGQSDKVFVIKDEKAPMSVTNDLERVIKECRKFGFESDRQEFFYFDSCNSLTQAIIDERGDFVGWANPTPEQRYFINLALL